MKSMKHADIIFGTVGTASTAVLTQVNTVLACIAGVLTVGVMALRFRREWKNRNRPPREDD